MNNTNKISRDHTTASENSGAITEQIWREYWNKEGWLDFTGEKWTGLTHARQWEYATAYQKWYAQKIGESVECDFVSGKLQLRMVLVPPGKFWMGSVKNEQGRDYDEGPRHRVLLKKGYWISKYEVTQENWATVTGEKPWLSEEYAEDNPRHAVSYVSWDDVKVKFLPALGEKFLLPSEAQWEYACRGGTSARFYWGEDLDERKIGEYAWHDGNAWFKEELYAHTVGQKKPNAWGLHDMIGNVWEWCEDSQHDNYEKAPVDGSAWVNTSVSEHVARGGSFCDRPKDCRSACRDESLSSYRWDRIGLRLVKSVNLAY